METPKIYRKVTHKNYKHVEQESHIINLRKTLNIQGIRQNS